MLERRTKFWRGLALAGAMALAGAVWAACGGDATAPVPTIQNINNSTDPASPVGLAIEINGSGFRTVPGRIRFAEGGNVAEVTPDASGWSETGIIVNVPSTGDDSAFAVPGAVEVTVITSGGTSNAVALDLVTTPSFSVENVTWAETQSLSKALAGLRAAAIPNTSTSAWLIVAGGYDGSANTDSVWQSEIQPDGQISSPFSPTTVLPAPRAHHGIAVAHPRNSPVGESARYVYVIGGQAASTDAPGGTSTVYVGSVSLANGTISSWSTTAAPALPAALVGPAVAVYNGYVYVVGGLRTDSTPSSAVYSAAIQSNGGLGSWRTATNAYPQGISFAVAFGFGGNLYVLSGDAQNSGDPNEQGTMLGVKTARYATVRNGAVGTWVQTSELVKQRKKHIHWTAFGQVIAAEGVYDGGPGNLELEGSAVLSTGHLDSWTGLTAVNRIAADVYNAAAVVSPIRPSDPPPAANGPRFLLLGGQKFVQLGTGALSDKVYYNTAP